MTPDCPMSPGEQDSPDLVCKWLGCGASFDSLDGLVSHLTAAHVTAQHGAFFCFWHGCSRTKGFNARYKMLIHIRTHTNERPYVCGQCDKRFSRQENLRIHARTHTGEKPYVCTVAGCGKAYSNSSDRFKHTRTHFVDKPYECRHPGCGKRYTDPSSLRKHVKIYGHYRRAEDATTNTASTNTTTMTFTTQNSAVPPTSSPDLLDASPMSASARMDLSPSPSSSGSSLVPSPVPSTPSPSLLPPTLFHGAPTGTGMGMGIGMGGGGMGMGGGVGVGAAGLSSWSPVTAWTVALQQYQAGLLLQGGAGLAGLGGLHHGPLVEEEDEEDDDDDDERGGMNSSAALDLSICPSPLDLSLPSSRAKHQ